MADSFLAREVSDLCLGKPALRSLALSSTVADALSALRRFGDSSSHLSVWSCNHRHSKSFDVAAECLCVGKVCMVDLICFLAREENLKNPAVALQKPLSLLLNAVPAGLVRHLEPHASLLEAIDLILEGAQNLVIPIHSPYSSRKRLIQRSCLNSTLHDGGREFCWLTQEDIIRYLLNYIGFFSPLPNQTVDSLDIIDKESVLAVHYEDPASSALPLISQSLIKQSSVAILDSDGRLVGEISPAALNCCDESAAAAVATLSAGDLMTYIDCFGDMPEELVKMVKDRLEAKNLEAAAAELMAVVGGDDEESPGISSTSSSNSSSSSDEEFGGGRKSRREGYSPPRVVRSTEDIMCHPRSSLVAVMIQMLSHRTGYIWVVEEDGGLIGVVTYAAMMKVFRQRL